MLGKSWNTCRYWDLWVVWSRNGPRRPCSEAQSIKKNGADTPKPSAPHAPTNSPTWRAILRNRSRSHQFFRRKNTSPFPARRMSFFPAANWRRKSDFA